MARAAVGWFLVIACFGSDGQAHWPWSAQEGAAPPQRSSLSAHEHGHLTWIAPDSASSVLSTQRADPNEVYEITILFFFTDQFADDFRDGDHMEDEIEKSVELLNVSLANSHVNATFEIVGIEKMQGMPTRQFRAMDFVANNSRAKRRRDEVNADLVYVLVDDPTGYAGVACQPSAFVDQTGENCFVGSSNNWTPSIRQFDNENIWRTILRHEVGHLLGIQHSPEFGGDPRGGFHPGAVGYTETSGDPWFGTVMGGNELPRFSTSSERFDFREHKNLVVGRRGIHEASTALLHSIEPVSNYRPRRPMPDPDPEPEPEPEPDYTDCTPVSAQISFDHGYEVRTCFEHEQDGNPVQSDAFDYGLESAESGLLYFFDRDNAEILIKVLDACAVNGHRWVFVAPVTDVALNLEVREVSTGKRWRYRNPAGKTADTKSDTAAFPCDAAAASWGASSRGAGDWSAAPPGTVGSVRSTGATRRSEAAAVGAETDCTPEGPVLSLKDGYGVSMCYETAEGVTGQAMDWELDSRQSALLYFFDPNNVEVLIKVLDGCGVNGHRWVFVAPVTDLAFNLYVESPAGERWIHRNRLGQTADAAGDTSAFPCGASA